MTTAEALVAEVRDQVVNRLKFTNGGGMWNALSEGEQQEIREQVTDFADELVERVRSAIADAKPASSDFNVKAINGDDKGIVKVTLTAPFSSALWSKIGGAARARVIFSHVEPTGGESPDDAAADERQGDLLDRIDGEQPLTNQANPIRINEDGTLADEAYEPLAALIGVEMEQGGDDVTFQDAMATVMTKLEVYSSEFDEDRLYELVFRTGPGTPGVEAEQPADDDAAAAEDETELTPID